jgi:hypothetical protein
VMNPNRPASWLRSARGAALLALLLGTASIARAGDVTTIITYPSSVSSDANGPLDLKAELNYDDTRLHAPVFVVMHGFSPTTGNLDNVRANAQRLRDKGFLAISVALRGRDGSDGVRDSGGVEIHDIYDAVEFVKAAYAPYVDPTNVSITGYSGGGGNVMSALVRFPDTFRVGAGFFGMSDYGFDPVDSWYFKGAAANHKTILRTDVGDPLSGDPDVTDRYHARASCLAAGNNPYSEIHLFVNASETTCPPVNDFRYRFAASDFRGPVDQVVPSPGKVWNVSVHVGGPGLWVDFNLNGVPDPDEWQDWPHTAPSANQQAAAENWYIERLLSGAIPPPVLKSSGTLMVLGYVRTRPFTLWLGDGQDAVADLAYDVTASAKRLELHVASIDKTITGALCVETADMAGQVVTIALNGAPYTTILGGSTYCHAGLADGDVLELTVP